MAGHDACVHLACISSWTEQRNASMETTILAGTENVLRAAAANGVRRVVFVSSAAAVAGYLAPKVANEQTLFPDECRGLRYAVAKNQAEARATAISRELGVELVIVNPAEVYGPEDYALVTAGNLRDVLNSWPAMACKGGTAVTHVEDVADGIVAALDRGRSGERYILGGDNLTVRELVTQTLRSAKRRVPLVVLPSWVLYATVRFCEWLKITPPMHPDVVPYATRYWFVDSTKAKTELGYAPRSASETIDETVKWLQAYLERV